MTAPPMNPRVDQLRRNPSPSAAGERPILETHGSSLVSQLPRAATCLTLLLALVPLAAASPARAEGADASVAVATPSDGVITLAEAVARAVQDSPDLAGAGFAVRAREAAILQARKRLNPQLAAEVENIGGDSAATGGRQSTLSLQQDLELGGKRAARMRVADASRAVAQWEYESRRVALVAHVSRSFLEVLAAQRKLELAEQSVDVAEEVAGIVAERVSAGKVSPIEDTRASLALTAETLERDRAESELFSARLRLASTWAATTATFASAVGDLDALPVMPTLDALLARVERIPELEMWTAEVGHRQAVVDLERARAAPDVTVSGGYRVFDSDTEAFVVGVTLPLPLADRNQGARQEAQQELLRAGEQRRSAQLRVRQNVAESHAALVRAEREIRKIREQMIPDAESAFAAVNEGYRLGKFGYVEVLDARRVLAAVRTQLLRAVVEMHRASADLERLTGVGMNLIMNGSERDEN